MLHFLNPGGLRRGRTKGVGGSKTLTAILPWFTVTASHTAPHYLYHGGGEGGVGGERKEEEEERRGGGENRYHILARDRSGQPDWSLSCVPLEACSTKHRPVDSLRTLLL